jgi:FKBP-type peptidyl-prolyl cis-trans isomerase SlpA
VVEAAMSDNRTIQRGSRVILRYALSLADGTVIEETGEDSETLTIGQGEFINELEQKLYGLKAGDSEEIVIRADENLFGAFDESRVQPVERSAFDAQMTPEPGTIIEFGLPNGTTIPGIIRDVDDEQVLVDFNHPLCRRDLMLAVEIVSVE